MIWLKLIKNSSAKKMIEYLKKSCRNISNPMYVVVAIQVLALDEVNDTTATH